MRKAFAVTVDGREVVLVELTPTELLRSMQAAGVELAGVGGQMEVATQGLKSAIRKVDDKAVSYQDVLLAFATWFPLARHLMTLVKAFGSIHSPTSAEADRFRASWSMEQALDGERWTATLPNGRAVTLKPAAAASLSDILTRAEQGSRNPAAQSFAAMLDGLRRAVVSIDGNLVSLDARAWDNTFSCKETQLVGVLWNEINGVQGEVGEVRLVPGI